MDAPTKRILLIGALALAHGSRRELRSIYGALRVEWARQEPLPVIGTLARLQLDGVRWDGGQQRDPRGQGLVRLLLLLDLSRGLCADGGVDPAHAPRAVADIPGARAVGITCDPDVDTLGSACQVWGGLWLRPAKLVHLVRDEYEAVQRFRSGNAASRLWRRRVTRSASKGADKVYHSSRFFLIDEKGRLRGYYRGFELEATQQLLRDMRRLAADEPGRRAETMLAQELVFGIQHSDLPLVDAIFNGLATICIVLGLDRDSAGQAGRSQALDDRCACSGRRAF